MSSYPIFNSEITLKDLASDLQKVSPIISNPNMLEDLSPLTVEISKAYLSVVRDCQYITEVMSASLAIQTSELQIIKNNNDSNGFSKENEVSMLISTSQNLHKFTLDLISNYDFDLDSFSNMIKNKYEEDEIEFFTILKIITEIHLSNSI